MAHTDAHPDREVSPFLLRFFARRMRAYVRKSFHAVRVSREGDRPELGQDPAIVYLNHPSWWDPLVGMVLAFELFPQRRHYAPIEEAMLERYRFMRKLGFYGVDATSRAGLSRFVGATDAILQGTGATLWITAAGRFADPRERPIEFKPGLGHLAARAGDARFVPLAVEYPFWEERFPEALCRFGEQTRPASEATRTTAEWTAHFEGRLTATQDALSREAIERDPQRFRTLLEGRVGIGGIYDLWRSWRARLSGKKFHPGHGGPEE